MNTIDIVLNEDVACKAEMQSGKPVIVCEADGITLAIPAALVRKFDLKLRSSQNIRHCACGYCGTSCSDNGTCYCGNCYFDC